MGHTHRPVPVTQDWYDLTTPNDKWYANPGTLRDIVDVPYMQRKYRGTWGQGIVVGVAKRWRYEGNYVPTWRAWEAETIIRRMYDEVAV